MRTTIAIAGILCLGTTCFAAPNLGDVNEVLRQAKAKAADTQAPGRAALADDVVGSDLNAGKPEQPVEWVAVGGGKFTMGRDDGDSDARPIHEVTIKTFEMSKTLVTVEQYAECVAKRRCSEPATGNYCNWGMAGRRKHPVNCVSWDQANEFARFMSARLPSEAEWEYAATSGGKNRKYPWGNDAPTCEKAVMYGNGNHGCGSDSTMPVCSKPAGNAKVSGGELCDMAGNVWQWVQDKYQNSYANAPTDGSAYEAAGSYRVMRGGSFYGGVAGGLRADLRIFGGPGGSGDFTGLRLARSSR